MTLKLATRPFSRNQTAAVQRVLESNPEYARRVRGVVPAQDAADEVLTALPPSAEPAQKVDFGLWDGETLVAFADVIVGWPSSDTAHIGLLMVDGERHSQGLGRRMHAAVLDLIGARSQIQKLRLSIVDTNADLAEPFWSALGYEPTGEVVSYASGCVESATRIWTRPIDIV